MARAVASGRRPVSDAQARNFVPELLFPEIFFVALRLDLPVELGMDFKMIPYASHHNILFQTGIFAQCRRNQDAVLLVRYAIMSTPDKYPPEAAHAVAGCGLRGDSILQSAPLLKGKNQQAVVHPGNDNTFAIPALRLITKAGRDNDAPFFIDGMVRAASEHK